MQVDNYKEAQLYTGNGITTQFDFYFSFGATAEIKVFVAGEELASNQYSVSSVNYQSGGTVICLVAPILNAAIRIERQTPFTQESAFSNFNQVDLKKLETSLDKMVRIEQELRNAIDTSAESNFQNQIDAISDVLTEVSEFTQDIDDDLQEHKENTENPHSVTKTQVGLGNVDNTSDVNKPVSTATQTALNAKADLSGATFTDAISATNLSGTNTGDETDSTIKTKLGITTLSGSNTGDQDLSGYALDDEVVHLAGADTIYGVKTFNASPIVPTPITDTQIANKGYVDANTGSGVPVGAIIPLAIDTAPTGYIKADGSALSRTTYAALFTVYGTSFGAGDGSTTFNIADYRACVLRGFDGGTLTAADMYTKQLSAAPNLTGNIVRIAHVGSTVTNGVLRVTPIAGTNGSCGTGVTGGTLDIDASRANAAYGRDSTTEVRPTNFAVNFFIKY